MVHEAYFEGGGNWLAGWLAGWLDLLPVTHVFVDTWMLTIKPVYKLLKDLKWTTNTHVTQFSLTFKSSKNIYGFRRLFAPSFFFRPPYFYPSIFVFTRPNDGWVGLYIKLWVERDTGIERGRGGERGTERERGVQSCVIVYNDNGSYI